MTTLQQPRIAHLCERITAEYLEMPGLSLTKSQMQRLWSLEAIVCDTLIEALVSEGVVRKTLMGTYMSVRSGA